MSLAGPFPLDSVEVSAAAASIKSALGLSGVSGTNTGDETTESVLGLLQGAEADPTKIGAEHLPDEIPDTIFGLADTSALTLANNYVGLDASGNLVIHNGVDLGGNRFDGKALRGSGRISAASAATTAQIITLAECLIHTAENVNSSEWMLCGKVRIASNMSGWTGAVTPRVGIYLVGGDGVPASQTSANRGYNVEWDSAAQIATIEFQNRLTMSASSVVAFNVSAADGGTIVQNITGGTIAQVNTKLANGTGIASTRHVVPGEVKVRLYAGLDVDSSGADSSAFIYYAADCRLVRLS